MRFIFTSALVARFKNPLRPRPWEAYNKQQVPADNGTKIVGRPLGFSVPPGLLFQDNRKYFTVDAVRASCPFLGPAERIYATEVVPFASSPGDRLKI